MTIFWICFFIIGALVSGFVILLALTAAVAAVGNDFDDANDIYFPKGPKNDYEGKS
jgi:hypothetical protein